MDHAPLITLTTDFGTADGYVGAMKGVMLSILPGAQLVDISHEIAPQDVRRAAYVIGAVYPFFPPYAVHLVVVDPGVGSARRPIALRTPAGTFVGPDNGVLSYVVAREPIEEMVDLSALPCRLARVSYTFHGRDIFAPAAAHLAAGVPLSALGSPAAEPVLLPPPRLEIAPDGVVGEVLHADRFGNIITDIGMLTWDGDELVFEPAGLNMECIRFKADQALVKAAGREFAGVRRTYADVEQGDLLALVSSDGRLEIAARGGCAVRELGLGPGDTVTLCWRRS